MFTFELPALSIYLAMQIVLPPFDVSANVKRPWGPEQATGAPDTQGAGDLPTAWASATEDAQDEWLELEYENSVQPACIIIHETYNPGAVYQITGYSRSGMEARLWAGEDPTQPAEPRGISRIPIHVKLTTRQLRIHLRSMETAGWNEIDAVGMEDAEGNVQWAIRATASSTYADR